MAINESSLSLEAEKAPWWLLLIGGIFNVIIGLLLLTVPVKTVITLVLALGFYWIITGIFTLVGMFINHKAWGWKLFSGVLSILAGMMIVRYPLISALEIPSLIILLLGVQGLMVGIVSLVLAFQGGGWREGILGALSILFGGILIASYGNVGTVMMLVWMVAAFALAGGILQIIHAFKLR